MTESTKTTMHIGELAERTGLSLRTIRHYDDVGLLPAAARTDGGFRLYTEADCDRLMVIKTMRKWRKFSPSFPPRNAAQPPPPRTSPSA